MIYTLGIDEMPGTERVEKADVFSYFENKPSLQLDTETTGIDPHSDSIIGLQMGDKHNQFVIDCRKEDVREFKPLIENKLCIGQNLKFDYKMLKAKGIIIENIWDVMLAECVLYSGYENWGYGLDSLVYRYLNITLSKEERESFLRTGSRPFTQRQVEYMAKDVTHLDDIRATQTKRLEQHDLVRCHDLENHAMMSLADMEYNGVGFAPEEWSAITVETQAEVGQLIKKLDSVVLNDKILSRIYKPQYVQSALFGVENREVKINYSSPIQILKVCKELGYEMESTDEQHLTKVKKKHEFFRVLMELRKKNKIVSTYGENFLGYINPVTGRIHTSFWQIVDTGRTSSGSRRDGTPNMQNIPATDSDGNLDNRFRNCFKARSGCKWVSSDYSGQEMRLMADASGEEGFIDVLNSGEDIHCHVGSMMFRRPITKEDKDLRYKAKTVNFMKPYGSGPDKLAFELDTTVEEAEQLFKEYARAFPKLNSWLERKGKEAKVRGYSTTIGPIGRKRFYPEMETARQLRKQANASGEKALWKQIFTIEGQTERNGGNSPVQGGGADMVKQALVEVRKLVQSYNIRYGEDSAMLVCTVHDAIDSDVIEDVAQNFAKEQTEIMLSVGNQYVSKVKTAVDTTITNSWTK